MANDRIYLKCKTCNGKILLYKFYPVPDGYLYPSANELDAWITNHLHDKGYCMNLNGDPGLLLETESVPGDMPDDEPVNDMNLVTYPEEDK